MVVLKILMSIIALLMVLNLIAFQPLVKLMFHRHRVGAKRNMIKNIASRFRLTDVFTPLVLILSFLLFITSPFWTNSGWNFVQVLGLGVLMSVSVCTLILALEIRSFPALQIRSNKQALVSHLIYSRNYYLFSEKYPAYQVEYNSPLYYEIRLLNRNLKKHEEMIDTLYKVKDEQEREEWKEMLSGQLEELVKTINNQFDYLISLKSGDTEEDRVKARKEKEEQEMVEKRLLSYVQEGKTETGERSSMGLAKVSEHESIRDLKLITSDDTIPSMYRERAKDLLHQIEAKKEEKETEEEFEQKIMNVEMVLNAVAQHHKL